MIDPDFEAEVRKGDQVIRAEAELADACANAITPKPDDLSFLFTQEFGHLFADLSRARLRRALELKKQEK